jgi:hypothetical protein
MCFSPADGKLTKDGQNLCKIGWHCPADLGIIIMIWMASVFTQKPCLKGYNNGW